jgi:hypothetical protein
MPQRVTWNLQYATRTEDQLNMMRHHFETFRHDRNVVSVSLTESADVPHLQTMTVEFAEDRDQPETRELQYMDRRYPVHTTARVEHQIHVEAPPPPTQLSMPRITGMSNEDTFQLFQRTARELREGTSVFFEQMIDQAPQGPAYGPWPDEPPEWLKIGQRYISRTKRRLVTVLSVQMGPGVPVVEFSEMNEGQWRARPWMLLDEFASEFEPYVPDIVVSATRPRTSWKRLLDDED